MTSAQVKILFFADDSKRGCGATVKFPTGEPCMMSIAQSGIWVKKSRFGLFGAVLYNEKNAFINAQRTGALAYLFPERRYPDGITSLNLRAFFNALLHCNDAAEASVTLNRAIQMAEQKAGCTLDEIPVSEYPAWVLSSKERATTTSITLTTSDVARIMQEYSGLLEKYPTAYMDEKWLPVPKDQMRLVLKAAWKMAPNAELRKYVEIGWTLLSMFQTGVGDIPVDGDIPRDPKLISEAHLQKLDRYVVLGKLAEVEGDKELVEMRSFIAANQS
jgi:hypothetical protein